MAVLSRFSNIFSTFKNSSISKLKSLEQISRSFGNRRGKKQGIVGLDYPYCGFRVAEVVPPNEYEMFKSQTWFKHKEVIPLVVVISAVLIGLPLYALYMSQSRNDVNYSRDRRYPPEKTYDLTKPKSGKIFTFNQHITPDPQLIESLKFYKDYELPKN